MEIQQYKNIKKEFDRNLKISILDKDFSINPHKFNLFKLTDFYNDYLKYGENYPITGSWGLYLFDLINRKPNDLDIVVDYIPSGLKQHEDDGYIVVHGLNSLGYKKMGNTKFDFFKNDTKDTIQYDNIKFTHPIHAILAKIAILDDDRVLFSDRNKHLKDLEQISNNL